MSLNRSEVAKIARLARLDIPDDRLDGLAGELTHILDWIEQLQEVATDETEPMSSVIEMALKTRTDVVDDGDKADDVLVNAPESANGYYVVPKVIE
ncbi:MAG: Asp-tRNA(Asn)/Glu-tRNA(Gln) amidotransferase subunit GatC [Alphaproteobacteria bacterium]|nr:Asp-tRNA(Asn)/Glu-tRNA(Gln) amidotransferase subunit GatC [Alphaproteobacteria bacterium]